VKDITNAEIQDGDILVYDGWKLSAWSNAEKSSALPGLVRVECAFGTLYLDPDGKVSIEEPEK